MERKRFITLSQANISNLCEGRLRVNLPLPYGLDERIEINPNRIDGLRRVAGFSRIILTRDDESGTSQVVPQIDGINADGTATARKAKIKTVAKSTFEFEENNMTMTRRASWPELTIKVNTEEIQQRLLNKRKVNLHNQKLWTKELDKVFRNTTTKSGLKHLLEIDESNFIETFLFYTFCPIPIIATSGSLPGVAYSLFLKGMFDGIISHSEGIEKKDRGRRILLVTLGPEIERAMALSVYSRIGSVIRAKAEEKK